MSEVKKVQCPHCDKLIKFRKNSTGKWVGTIIGGGTGVLLASGLGIAGAICGVPIAISAVLIGLGIGALLGNRAGAMIDNATVECPNCGEKISF